MEIGQLIEYNNRKIFHRTLCRKWGRENSHRPLFFFFFKCLIWGKSKWSAAEFQDISISLNLGYNKNKLHQTLGYGSRDIFNFDFPDKGLGLVYPPYFVYDFSRIMFLMLYSSNWSNSIVWLLLLLEILDNVITMYYNCLLTRLWRLKLEINLIFQIKPFCYMTKKSRQKLKYLENEKSFWGEIKSIFHHF